MVTGGRWKGWVGSRRCECEFGKFRSERLASLDPPHQLCTLRHQLSIPKADSNGLDVWFPPLGVITRKLVIGRE